MEKISSIVSSTAENNPLPAAIAEENNKIGISMENLDKEFATNLDNYSLESIVELKIARFLDRYGNYEPEKLHSLIMGKVEKPLIAQILRRTGGNQVHAARILGINRNTLRKKMQIFKFVP